MMTNTVVADRVVGSVLGLAYGDATGYPTEFKHFPELQGKVVVPDRLIVSDDTQMSLAVWSALDSWDRLSMGTLRAEMIAAFRAWREEQDDPRWSRAPGGACMSACEKLGRVGQGRWESATGSTSAGCGSVMRAPWIGLHPKVHDGIIVEVAALQAVLTHGPAENVASSVAAAVLTRELASGTLAPEDMVRRLLSLADELAETPYPRAALGSVWRHVKTTIDGMTAARPIHSESHYMAEVVMHVEEIAALAGSLIDAFRDKGLDIDPCEYAGEGWRANECLAVAVGILGSCSFAPVDGLIRAAETNGDSDSIGAVTGALFGAAFGNVWPQSFGNRLEARYQRELWAVIDPFVKS